MPCVKWNKKPWQGTEYDIFLQQTIVKWLGVIELNGKPKAWLTAFAMGILLPSLLFSVAEKTWQRANVPQESTETTQQATQQTQPQAVIQETVAVLENDGSVEQTDMDTYLTCVLLGEMPADFDSEALKAQAVVARTYARKRGTTGIKHTGGAVCKDPACCQGYRSEEQFLSGGGTLQSLEKVRTAVADTAGQVLTYNGSLIDATYFSCSGGRTEDALAVWGSDVPYLQAVDSPGEEQATYHTNQITYTAREFASLLGIAPQGQPASWLGAVKRTAGGGVDTMVIAGTTYKGTTLRQALGLRSTAFTIYVAGEKFYITTKGYGHRVGMSQYGAEAMAVSGSSYGEILSHYYPGTTLSRWQQN